MNTSIPKVPVGAATVTGYGVSLVSLVLAVIAFLTGDRTEQTIGTIVAGAVSLGALSVTSIGRFLQAKALAIHQPQLASAVAELDQLLIDHQDDIVRRLTDALALGADAEPVPEEPGDPLDGLPDLATASPDKAQHGGDPMTRGDVQPIEVGPEVRGLRELVTTNQMARPGSGLTV